MNPVLRTVLWGAVFLFCLCLTTALLIAGGTANTEVGQNINSIAALVVLTVGAGVAIVGTIISFLGLMFSWFDLVTG